MLRLWVQLELTETIEVTNITLNRLRNYFPNLTPANAVRELFTIALTNGHLDTVHKAHRSDNFRGRF